MLKESSDNESVEVSIVISSSEEDDFVKSEPKARKASKKMFDEESSDSDTPVAPSRNLVSKKNRFVEIGSDSSEEDSFKQIETGRKDGKKISRKIEQISSEDDEDIEDEESGNLNSGQSYWK